MRYDKFYEIINKISVIAQSQKYEFISPELLIWACLQEDRFIEICKFCNARLDKIREGISSFLLSLDRTDDPGEVMATKDYESAIKFCTSYADKMFDDPNIEHILYAVLKTGGEDSFGRYTLISNGVTEKKIEKFMEIERERKSGPKNGFLTDLTEKASQGKIDPMIGRKEELKRIIQILHKKRACNPIIVSQPGVGKTALVEGLALAIINKEVPESLEGMKILSLNVGGLLAGTKFRGDFEDRLSKTIAKVTKEKAILFIDEIHMIVGAGSSQENSIDASNILKPYLTDSSLKCIGATTYDEYKKILKDKALSRRFKKIDLKEPSKKETVDILKGLRSKYEEFHKIKISDEIINKIVSLSAEYLKSSFFPDKAIEVMDEAGSMHSSHIKNGDEMSEEDVEEVICSIANLPSLKKEENTREGLKSLAGEIKKKLFGQDETIDKIVYHIKIAKAGLTSKSKPLGVFGLFGPTGTGKTELVKQIAEKLGWKFLRYDMSEYSEKNSISKLIGTSPGYIGFDQSGALTEPVIQNPNSVILMDEIEKADPEVYNLLLQVMDDGRLTDNQNRAADFTQTVLFFTSNVGSAEAEDASFTIGFAGRDKSEDVLEKSLKEKFPPEFRNRFTEIFRFHALGKEEMKKIVEKDLEEINQKLKDKNVTISLADAAVEWIADKAMEEKMGGRPVERLLQRHVVEKLVDKLLFENLSDSKVIFDLSQSTEELTFLISRKDGIEKAVLPASSGMCIIPEQISDVVLNKEIEDEKL